MEETKIAPYSELGERLHRLRSDRKMTRLRLGKICGIAPSTIVNYERGTRIPYADTAVKMAQTFGLTVEDLLGMEKPDTDVGKENIFDDLGRIFGMCSINSAQTYLDGTNALLASGALSIQDQLDFISIMRKVLINAEFRVKHGYTTSTFYVPGCKEKNKSVHSNTDVVSDSTDFYCSDTCSVSD